MGRTKETYMAILKQGGFESIPESLEEEVWFDQWYENNPDEKARVERQMREMEKEQSSQYQVMKVMLHGYLSSFEGDTFEATYSDGSLFIKPVNKQVKPFEVKVWHKSH